MPNVITAGDSIFANTPAPADFIGGSWVVENPSVNSTHSDDWATNEASIDAALDEIG